ncbi:MAG TPA: pyrroline-5-carboxylate reductase [Verrucomicrobiota bacterium]|nr:pyrroline-5-carboxylate reductase [Verrucomicrobiota bacterium]
MNKDIKIGFIGAGKMATALARGLCQNHTAEPSNILASDPIESARINFEKETNAKTTNSNAELLQFARVIFLAVKPQNAIEVLNEIKSHFTKDHLIISIAAGITISTIEEILTKGSRVIRAMPNAPALVGSGACGFSLGKYANSEDGKLALKLLSSVGIAIEVKEHLLDAVTGLSGSGPAYVFMVIEALSDGGVYAGLPRDVATKLAAATVMGAAKMVLETNLHTGQLKDIVTSPGGTTIEGIYELEKAGVRAAFISAVKAATEKSKTLGKK